MPATRDGVPFAQWYRLRVVFKLKNQQQRCDAGAEPASLRRGGLGRRPQA